MGGWLICMVLAGQPALDVRAPQVAPSYSIAVVEVETPAKHVLVEVNRLLERDGALLLSADSVPTVQLVAAKGLAYGFTGPDGLYLVKVISSDPTKGLAIEKARVRIGSEPDGPDDPDDPDPPPGPNPSVPDDVFDNLGRRVASWAAKVDAAHRGKAAELSALYRDTASKLDEGRHATINAAAEVIADGRNKILTGAAAAAWGEFNKSLNGDFNKRWPMSRGLVVDYFGAIAAGLGAVK